MLQHAKNPTQQRTSVARRIFTWTVLAGLLVSVAVTAWSLMLPAEVTRETVTLK
jgi:type VI protein secretion system component VasF